MNQILDCIIVGGGASGFFFAINYAENHPDHTLVILEKSKHVLQKVKISGGGRCNVTHAEFEPKPLTNHYPRGEKELIGPFHTFMTGDMMAWLNDRGIELKIENDGRIFPVTDTSQTIIDCFVNEVNKHHIEVKTSQNVVSFDFQNDMWNVKTKDDTYHAKQLVISTGSSKKIWEELGRLGHKIIPPVPSLFTFNIDHPQLTKLQGLSLDTHINLFKDATCAKSLLESDGATLITHWGLSGHCILKLSAWGAKLLNDLEYNFFIVVNWLQGLSLDNVVEQLKTQKTQSSKKNIGNQNCFNLPKRFWHFMLDESRVDVNKNWADLSKQDIIEIAQNLTQFQLEVNGKSTFKEEFVTAGGVDLKEIDFKTFSSKKQPQLKILGEALNIDAITGGFNFQSAWTSAFVAAKV
ncbi:NAD(P)/FAD-dependent oxidoreductase [Flavobacteriaceae bacterium 14752]|uniref:NAD(P)/FAD-dependent oxidoreductase n=1 Tax=Mesohalobacter salilacus TaxID=2491711 RepID=UPI000F6351AE|nr:NAD(P)/FAD-dependent oxidoreductase [Flavobacteriaceae bacterium 14752]